MQPLQHAKIGEESAGNVMKGQEEEEGCVFVVCYRQERGAWYMAALSGAASSVLRIKRYIVYWNS